MLGSLKDKNWTFVKKMDGWISRDKLGVIFGLNLTLLLIKLDGSDVKQLSRGMKCYHHYLARKKQREAHTSQQDFQVADTAGMLCILKQ